MSKSLSILMAMALTVPSIASAGPYVGLGIGGARMESSLATLSNGTDNLVPGLASDTDVIGSDPDFTSTDVSFDATAGWMLGEHFGVEIGYIDYGRATQNYELPEACNSFGCQSREWTAQIDMTAFRAFLVGNLPLNENFDVYAKIGAVSWDADYSGFEREQLVFPGPPIAERNERIDFDDDGTDMAAGLGLTLKTGSAFTLRADFTYYDVDSTDLLWTAQLMGIYTFE